MSRTTATNRAAVVPPSNVSAATIPPAAVNVHALRATAVTKALDHQADIAQVQAWCGHRLIATTKLYDRRQSRAEDSPTFKVAY